MTAVAIGSEDGVSWRNRAKRWNQKLRSQWRKKCHDHFPRIPAVAQHFLLSATARDLSLTGLFVNTAYHSK
jgi:hypothetical protein